MRTTSELCASLPDVSKATVYRHVSLLAKGKILNVVDERRVHGAMERRYQLHRTRAVIDQEAASSMSLEEHRHAFAAGVGALLADFNAYLNRAGADPVADSVSYIQVPLWLTKEELAEMMGQVRRVLLDHRDSGPGPDRSLYLVSPILFPLESPPVGDN